MRQVIGKLSLDNIKRKVLLLIRDCYVCTGTKYNGNKKWRHERFVFFCSGQNAFFFGCVQDKSPTL